MNWQTIRLADVPSGAWRNGGGVTHELLAWPSAQDWLWRMSVAQVMSSGPFSGFEGVTRWFAVLEGDGVVLTINGVQHMLTANDAPFMFDGGARTDCSLRGAGTQDFNLMVRNGIRDSRMERVRGEFVTRLNAPRMIAVYAIDTGALVHFEHQLSELAPASLAWCEVPVDGSVRVQSANALWIEVAL